MVYNIRRTWAHAATTADKLDIDGVEEGAPALQTRESKHEGTYVLKVGFGH